MIDFDDFSQPHQFGEDPSPTEAAARLEPGLASLPDRFGAQMLDFVASLVLAAPLFVYGTVSDGPVVALLGWVVFLYYRLLCDGFSGRSLGKRAVGIQVIESRSGDACGLSRLATARFRTSRIRIISTPP